MIVFCAKLHSLYSFLICSLSSLDIIPLLTALHIHPFYLHDKCSKKNLENRNFHSLILYHTAFATTLYTHRLSSFLSAVGFGVCRKKCYQAFRISVSFREKMADV